MVFLGGGFGVRGEGVRGRGGMGEEGLSDGGVVEEGDWGVRTSLAATRLYSEIAVERRRRRGRMGMLFGDVGMAVRRHGAGGWWCG